MLCHPERSDSFRDVVHILLRENPDVWKDCLDTLSVVTDISGIAGIPIEDILPTGYPASAERSAWRMLFPKVVVNTNNVFVFFAVGHDPIKYSLPHTTPRKRDRLTPAEKQRIMKLYQKGTKPAIIAHRIGKSANTIRTFIQKSIT